MNGAELKCLLAPDLSHQARSLYLLKLRPAVVQGISFVDIRDLARFLVSYSALFPTAYDEELTETLLDELKAHQLIEKSDPSAPWDTNTLILPLYQASLNTVPSRPFVMHQDWTPGPGFASEAHLCGLSDATFTAQELRAFIAYWSCKAELRGQSAWERAFAMRLISRRSAKRSNLKGRAKTEVKPTSSGVTSVKSPLLPADESYGAQASGRVKDQLLKPADNPCGYDPGSNY